MAEQQLIDYITKAKSAGQSDDQTKNLLQKNGWTDTEIAEAFSVMVKPEIKPEIKPEVMPEVKPETQTQQAEDRVIADTIKAIDQLDAKEPAQPVQPAAQDNPSTVLGQVAEPEVKPDEVKQPIVEDKPQIEEKPQLVQSQYSMGAVQENMPRMKTRSHGLMKGLIVLIILVVLGGAGYIVAGQYFDIWSPFAQTPEKVIEKMLSNMATAKSYHSVMNVDIDSIDSVSKASQGKLTINTVSDTDSSDKENLKANGGMKITLLVPGFESPVLSLSMDTVVIGTTSYLKVSNIVLPPEVTYPGLNISQLDGKWFQIDEDTYKALSQAEGGSASTTAITQADSLILAKKMQDLVDAKKINDEVINGQNTAHYSVPIGKEKIKNLINKIMDLGLQEASKLETKDASATMVQDIVKSVVGSLVDSVGDVNIDMWIGKKDNMLYQYKVDKTIDLTQTFGSATSFVIKVAGNNSNFNTPVAITTPEGSQKMEEIILPLLKDDKVGSKLNQIGFDAKALFDDVGSYSSLCNRGLVNGYLDKYGTDLVAMHTEIVNLGAAKPACFSNAKNYCVSTQLADGTFSCVGNADDSNTDCAAGEDCISPSNSVKSGTARCVSAETVCK